MALAVSFVYFPEQIRVVTKHGPAKLFHYLLRMLEVDMSIETLHSYPPLTVAAPLGLLWLANQNQSLATAGNFELNDLIR